MPGKTGSRSSSSRYSAFSILTLNARSVVNKKEKLEELCVTHQPDCITIVESWTNEKINNAELNIPGYCLLSRKDGTDTNDGRGRGILVYTKEGLRASASEKDLSFDQAVEFKIEAMNCLVVYRSPNLGNRDPELLSLMSNNGPWDIVLGDFNLPTINWKTKTSGTRAEDQYIELFQDLFPEQVVDFPTHQAGNVLDLVLVKEKQVIESIVAIPEEAISDHYPLLMKVITKSSSKQADPSLQFNFNRMDIEGFRALLSNINWTKELTGLSTENMWSVIKGHLHKAIEISVPRMKLRAKIQPMWMNKSTIQTIRKKKKAYKIYSCTHDSEDLKRYKKLIKDAKKKVRKSKAEFEKHIASSLEKQKFYRYVASRSKDKEDIGTLKDSKGKEISDSKEKANLLSSFFSEVLTEENDNLPNLHCHVPLGDRLQTVYFNPEKVQQAIQRSKDSLSAGPDGLPSRVYKVASDIMAYPLSVLFNTSMSSGIVPGDWKLATVKPIFKKGTRASASNYRPISLTSVACRIMERCIKVDLARHLEENNLINESQHGFRSGKSTLTNLLEYTDAIIEVVDEGAEVHAIYFDFKKAFDKVPHKKLLLKVQALGVQGHLLEWIKTWLCGRKQRVRVHDSYSEWVEVISSVPQGSVLGPLLFLIYINDISNVVSSQMSLFADDAKLFRAIKSIEDRKKLQDDINAMNQWSNLWQMEFNPSKCHVLSFGSRASNPQYTLAGNTLSCADYEKDVGVLVPSNLKFHEQCATAIAKANSVLGLIKRAFQSRDQVTMINAYKTYVQPHLDFCIQVWAPGNKAWQDKLEKVQKRALRLIPSLNGLDYQEKLKETGLLTLSDRRKMFDLVEVYKRAKKGQVCYQNSSKTTRSVEHKLLVVPKFRLDIKKNSFCVRATQEWNKIPMQIRESETLSIFKKNIKAYLSSY